MEFLRSLIRSLLNNGVDTGTNLIQRRRIRLLNLFNLVCGSILVIFFAINLLVGSTNHGFVIVSGIGFVTLPVIILNHQGKTEFAKYFLVLGAVAFACFISYKSIEAGYNRDNGFFLVGFSTVIVTLFDNPYKRIMFFSTVVTGLALKYYRLQMFPVQKDGDILLSMANVLLGFLCVYWFTDIFKEDLIKSEQKIKKYSLRGAEQSRKLLEQKEAIEYAQELMNTTINNIPVFIGLLNIESKFIKSNYRFNEVFLVPHDSIEGKRLNQLFQDENAEKIVTAYESCIGSGKAISINHPLSFPSGEEIFAFGRFIPLFDMDHAVNRVLVYIIDIKQLKETEHELREVNISKDKILSILSHDLRSPINSLSSLLNLSDDLKEDDFKALIKKIARQVETLGLTLNNLLNWVKTQLEGFQVAQQQINAYEVTQECIDLYQPQLDDKEIELFNNIQIDAEAVIDRDHLSLVMRNLISNAIKFTPQGGKIDVSSLEENGFLKLNVKDNGLGMDKELIKSLTHDIDSLKPISSLGTNGEKGTGLGLGFCKDILKLNQAQMEIQSAKKEGTSITISIPRS